MNTQEALAMLTPAMKGQITRIVNNTPVAAFWVGDQHTRMKVVQTAKLASIYAKLMPKQQAKHLARKVLA